MDNRSWYDIGGTFKLHQCLYLLETYEKQKNEKRGIFSGSFNPVHIGHLALANYLCEYEGLDEVWFLVTPHNPLKEEDELMDDAFRLKLVQLAIEGYPKFKASDIEFNLPRPSYKNMVFCKNTFRLIPAGKKRPVVRTDNQMKFPVRIGFFQFIQCMDGIGRTGQITVGTYSCRKPYSCISPSRLSGFFRFPFGECKSSFFSYF